MKLKTRLIFSALLTVLYVVAEAQQPQMNFTIKGIVKENETRKPLEYVNVVVYSVRDSSLISGSITLADGSFSIPVNRPGRFYLTADFIGFEKTIIQDIGLKPGNEIFNVGEISIKPAIVGIDEVEVVANRPYVSYQIDKKVVEVGLNPSAQGGTAVDALENVPSVQTDIEGNVSIRGSSNFTVLIDGRQSPISGSDALKQIPASSIDKIEIITNPSVKFDPDGSAGIINIISKKGKLNGHSAVINASAGNSPMYGGDITYSFRKDKFTLTTALNYRDGIMQMKDYEESTTTDNPDTIFSIIKSNSGKMKHENMRAKLMGDYQISKANTFSIGGEYSNFLFDRNFNSKINESTILNDSLDNTSTINTYYKSNQKSGAEPHSWQLILGDRHIFGENTEHFLSIDFTAQQTNGENYDFVDKNLTYIDWEDVALMQINKAITSDKGNRYRFEVNYSNPISEKIKFETGYTMRIDNSYQTYRRADTLIYNLWQLNDEYNDTASFTRSIHAGWFLLKGEIFGFQYSAGLRGESTDQEIKTKKDNQNYKYKYLGRYWSFALSKELKGGHQLQFNYSERINRPNDWQLRAFPSLTDGYTLFQPNPDLQPEYASSYEFNYQKSWGISFISAETFYRSTDNKIERIMLSESDTLTIYTVKNIDGDENYGGEVTANIKIAPWFIFNPSASYYYSIVSGEYLGENVERKAHNFRSTAMCNFTLPTKTRIQLSGNYRSGEKEIDGNEKEMYWASAALRQEFFNRKLSAALRIDDIFSSRKHRQTNYSGDKNIYIERQRKSPMFFLSLTYMFNQNGDKKRNGRDDMDEGGGGMDMDF